MYSSFFLPVVPLGYWIYFLTLNTSLSMCLEWSELQLST